MNAERLDQRIDLSRLEVALDEGFHEQQLVERVNQHVEFVADVASRTTSATMGCPSSSKKEDPARGRRALSTYPQPANRLPNLRRNERGAAHAKAPE
jgi:hypothetical protein